MSFNFMLDVVILGGTYIFEIMILIMNSTEKKKEKFNKITIGFSIASLLSFIGVIIYFKRKNNSMMLNFIMIYMALFFITVVCHVISLTKKTEERIRDIIINNEPREMVLPKIESSENPTQEIKINNMFKELILKTELQGRGIGDRIKYIEDIKDVLIEYKKYGDMLLRDSNFADMSIASLGVTKDILEEFNKDNTIKNPRVNQNKEKIIMTFFSEVEKVKMEVLRKIDNDIYELEKLK